MGELAVSPYMRPDKGSSALTGTDRGLLEGVAPSDALPAEPFEPGIRREGEVGRAGSGGNLGGGPGKVEERDGEDATFILVEPRD